MPVTDLRGGWRRMIDRLAWMPAPAAKRQAMPVQLVLVSPDQEFSTKWAAIASRSGWTMLQSPSIDEARTVLANRSEAIVVLDWAPGIEDWRPGVEALCTTSRRACVILASHVVDENLRHEVLRLHGFDVLPRAADREEIVRKVNFAWFWITRSEKQEAQ